MKRSCACLLGALWMGACEARSPAPQPPGSQVQPAAPQAVSTAPSAQPERRFGSPPQLAGAAIPVEQLLAAPEPHLDKPVKCEGKVARVCQHQGCWLELAASGAGDGEGLRVPMAGHAFFIPKNAVGQLATVEGQLRRHELAPAQREHYRGEGMQAVGPLSLEAVSVVLRTP